MTDVPNTIQEAYRLLTRDGEFVTEVLLPRFRPDRPDAIVWGLRTFIQGDSEVYSPYDYTEAFVFYTTLGKTSND